MLHNALFASVIALGAAGMAQAQDLGPRLVGGGEDAQVVYAEPSRNVAGGGVASISGGGNNMQIAYGPRVTTQAGIGLFAELTGGGDNAEVVYRQVAPSATMLAGRSATGESLGPRAADRRNAPARENPGLIVPQHRQRVLR
jgi:hypothetical protein